MIRFRLRDVGEGTQYDGWYIDDVCIQETDKPVIAYPFIDDMENGAVTDSNWLSSSWELIEWDYHSPTHSWTESPEGNCPAWVQYEYHWHWLLQIVKSYDLQVL